MPDPTEERIPSTGGWFHVSTMSEEEAAFDRALREAEAEADVAIWLTREQIPALNDVAYIAREELERQLHEMGVEPEDEDDYQDVVSALNVIAAIAEQLRESGVER